MAAMLSLSLLVIAVSASADEDGEKKMSPGFVDVVTAEAGTFIATGDGTLRRVSGDTLPIVKNVGVKLVGLAVSADARRVAAVGNGVLVRSGDGGRTFTSTPLPGGALAYATAFCGADLFVFARTGEAFRYRGTEAVRPVELPVRTGWFTASFSGRTGWVTGTDALAVTRDCGETWAKVALPAKDCEGVLARGDTVYVGASTGVFRSDDFGQTFRRVFAPDDSGKPPYCVRLAARGKKVVAACSQWQRSIAWSEDGETFTAVKSPLTSNLLAVAFVSDDEVVGVGPWETFIRARRDGSRLIDHSAQTKQWLEMARERAEQESRPPPPPEPPAPPPRVAGPDANVFAGTLRDERGAPVAGQKLFIIYSWAHHGEGYQEAVTDAGGAFRFVTHGSVRLSVDRKGSQRIWDDFAVDAFDGTRVELIVRAAVTLSGRVDSAAITGGEVRALPLPPEGADLTSYLFRTRHFDSCPISAGGTFSFPRLGAGEYLLDVRPEGALAFTARVKAPARDVVLTAQAGGRLTGLIRDAQGNGLAGAQVWVSEVSRGSHFTALVTAGPDGRFEVAGVPDAELEVSANPAGERGTVVVAGPLCRQTTVRMTSGAAHVELQLGAGGTIRGSVIDAAGKPVVGANVIATGGSSFCGARAAKSGTNGSFTLVNVNPGPNDLFATVGEGDDQRFSERVNAAAGDVAVKLVVKSR